MTQLLVTAGATTDVLEDAARTPGTYWHLHGNIGRQGEFFSHLKEIEKTVSADARRIKSEPKSIAVEELLCELTTVSEQK